MQRSVKESIPISRMWYEMNVEEILIDALNVEQILITALKSMGADGLCNPRGSCGCGLEDFAPCSKMGGWEFAYDCVPAKRGEDGLYHPMED